MPNNNKWCKWANTLLTNNNKCKCIKNNKKTWRINNPWTEREPMTSVFNYPRLKTPMKLFPLKAIIIFPIKKSALKKLSPPPLYVIIPTSKLISKTWISFKIKMAVTVSPTINNPSSVLKLFLKLHLPNLSEINKIQWTPMAWISVSKATLLLSITLLLLRKKPRMNWMLNSKNPKNVKNRNKTVLITKILVTRDARRKFKMIATTLKIYLKVSVVIWTRSSRITKKELINSNNTFITIPWVTSLF